MKLNKRQTWVLWIAAGFAFFLIVLRPPISIHARGMSVQRTDWVWAMEPLDQVDVGGVLIRLLGIGILACGGLALTGSQKK